MYKSVTQSMMRFAKMLSPRMDLEETQIVMDLQQLPLVGRLRGSSVTMFPSKNAEIFQDSNATMFQGRLQGKNANLFQDSSVTVSHNKFVTVFQASNVQMFQGRLVRLFQDKLQDRNVKMFQGSLARLFQDKNVNQFQSSSASRCLAE